MGFVWPHSPLIPLGSEQLPQVVVWVFTPASDFLPQPQPAPGCGDNRYCTDLSCPQQPCTRKCGSSHGPRPQPALPVWNPGRQMARVCRDAFGAQTKMTSNRMGWW